MSGPRLGGKLGRLLRAWHHLNRSGAKRFERYVSDERRESADIDVGFEHERLEIVMQWVFDTHGRSHAALCSTVIRQAQRLADVAQRALGTVEELLSSQIWGWSEDGVETKRLNLNLEDQAAQACAAAFSQQPGGFVLNHDRPDELEPGRCRTARHRVRQGRPRSS